MSYTSTEITVALYADHTKKLIEKILAAQGDIDYDVSDRKVKQVAKYFIRDIIRIRAQQGDRTSATKFAGYWGFWIRKIKPIRVAYDRTHAGYSDVATRDESEIIHVNEQVAIETAISWLIHVGKRTDEKVPYDSIRSQCSDSGCDGKTCIRRYVANLFAHSDRAFEQYLTYCMLHRTFGPHHVTMMLDQILHASCAGSCLAQESS